MDGKVYSESVRIRLHDNAKRDLVPPKGIDIVFEQQDNDRGKEHEYIATLIGSDILPEESRDRKDLVNVLADWNNIVSDRVRVKNQKPLKHTIDTFVDRPKTQMSDQLNSRINALSEEQVTTIGKKKWARVFSDVIQ